MKTYTNPVHPEQGFDPRTKQQVKADKESQQQENQNDDSELGSDDDNLDDGSGSTENPAVQESMN